MKRVMAIFADRGPSILGPRNRTWAIFLVSVLVLFLELLLIRWISTEIRIFAYLQNTVVIVCLLGLGMGCFTCREPINVRHMLIALLVLVTLLAVPWTRGLLTDITEMLSVLGDFVIWYTAVGHDAMTAMRHVAIGLGLTLLLMVLLWEIFLPLGRMLGRLMDDHPETIWAYTINIAGSLAGIGLFVVLSVFCFPPAIWFLVAGVLMFWFLGRGAGRLFNLGVIATIVLAAYLASWQPDAIRTTWSPYQKLVLKKVAEDHPEHVSKYRVSVNNCGYQGMLDLSEEAVRANPHIPPNRYGLSQYDIPLLLQPNPEHVLIVGAGTGNDVAGALRGGAQSVTAVEIDPAIIEMGREYHPERPYDSPKVRIVTDDARSFFATTKEKYDLIIFGLLDSHTTTAMTNARLDHYVYTQESIARSRSLLADGGVVALSFEASKPYISDRIARCINQVFGYNPLVFRIPYDHSGWGGVMFVTGEQRTVENALAENERLAGTIEQWQTGCPVKIAGTTRVTTDDWPYLYLEKASIPSLYYLLAGLMLVLFMHCKWRLRQSDKFQLSSPMHWHFFFLGAAFLLLEVQNISKAAVVLGNTWWVNAVVIGGILTMILLANLIEAKLGKRLPSSLVWSGLIGTCIALYFVDLSRFAFLPYATKVLVVGLLTTLPMLFSGIVFIRSFAAVERKDLALGANLFGSLVGGILQSLTFMTGIKALLLIVAGLYLAAFLTRQKKSQPISLEPSTQAEPTVSETFALEEAAEPVGV
jgi:spermidine synthase